MAADATSDTVGIVGLGAMGFCYARLLREAGHRVVGYDTSPENMERAVRIGVEPCASPRDLATQADFALTALPSAAALRAVCEGPDGIAASGSDCVVVELSTLSLDDKEACRAELETAGIGMVDCPVSGTSAQAEVGDLDVFASGESAHLERLEPIFRTFAKNVYFVGDFGSGTKFKMIANLLVTIHNASTAEALLLAEQAGLDLDQVVKFIGTGAGSSRMFQVRGPLMASGRYTPATARFDIHAKDISLISGFANRMNCPTPLFAASSPLYVAAIAQGMRDHDTSAVFEVLRTMAGRRS